MDDGDIKQLMQEIEFVLKRNQNEKYLRVNQIIVGHMNLLHDFQELLVLISFDVRFTFSSSQPQLGNIKLTAN